MKDLLIRLLLSTQNFDSNLKNSARQVKQFKDQCNQVSKGLDAFSAQLGINVNMLAKFGGAFGAAALAGKTLKESLMTNADFMDAFNIKLEQSKALLDGFFSSLGNGRGIGDFFRNWGDIAKSAESYAKSVDDANTAHNTMNDAMAMYAKQVEYCNVMMRDPALSGEERKKWIDLQNLALQKQLEIQKLIAKAEINKRNQEFNKNMAQAGAGAVLTEEQKGVYEGLDENGLTYWSKRAEKLEARINELQAIVNQGTTQSIGGSNMYGAANNYITRQTEDASRAQQEINRIIDSSEYKIVEAYKELENQGKNVSTYFANLLDGISIDVAEASNNLIAHRTEKKLNGGSGNTDAKKDKELNDKVKLLDYGLEKTTLSHDADWKYSEEGISIYKKYFDTLRQLYADNQVELEHIALNELKFNKEVNDHKVKTAEETAKKMATVNKIRQNADNQISRSSRRVDFKPQYISSDEKKAKNADFDSKIGDVKLEMNMTDNLDELQKLGDQLQYLIDKKNEFNATHLVPESEAKEMSKDFIDMGLSLAATMEKGDMIDKFSAGFESISSVAGSLGEGFAAMAEKGEAWNTAAKVMEQTTRSLAAALAVLALINAIQEASKMPFPANMIAIATASALTMGAIMMAMSAFETGGIVGGNSYHGDKQTIRVNSGEMILNPAQQKNLFDMINEGNFSKTSSAVGGQVEFKIKGKELVGVLANYTNKVGKAL